MDKQYEQEIHEGLECSYKLAKAKKNELHVSIEDVRLVLFSDLHRGVRDGADDFWRCERAYCAALGYYLESGYSLILLGDAEELWECRPRSVVNAYRATLLLEAEFHKSNRYHRISGNHDDYWEEESGVRKLLGPLFGSNLTIRENMRIIFDQSQQPTGEILVVHGHQGDYLCDRAGKFSKFFVRNFWRPFQRLTNIKSTTPASNHELRDDHGMAMYSWAEMKKGLLLIAGHTHKPVFESKDHAARIEAELKQARAEGKSTDAVAKYRAQLELVKAQGRENKEGGFSMSKPCYFNTGCCSFSDGDVTGVEIADQEIRLVRWPDDEGNPERKILHKAKLRDVLDSVRS